MRLRLAILGLLLIVAPNAVAGDACPVQLNIRYLGSPEWLDNDAILDGIETQQRYIGISNLFVDGKLHLTKVSSNSPAGEAGLETGMIITQINGFDLPSEEFTDAIFDGLKIGERFVLTAEGRGDFEITMGRTDPFAFALYQGAANGNCTAGGYSVDEPNLVTDLHDKFFDAGNGFRCNDAHIALQDQADDHWVASDIYVIRGSKRTLISQPYWGTKCVMNSEVDAPEFSLDDALNLVSNISADYVEMNLANP